MNKKIILMSLLTLGAVADVMPAARGRGGKFAQIAATKNKLFNAIREQNIRDLRNCLKNDFIKNNINTLYYTSDQKVHDKCVGLTPLQFATLFTWIEGMQELLQAGALLDAGSNRVVEKVSGEAPLHIFASISHHATDGQFGAIKKIIQQQRPNLEIQDKDLWTPIFYAAQEGDVRAIALFIELGVNVNHRDNLGNTPLYIAVQGKPEIRKFGSSACAELLMQAGANPNLPGEQGMTPLHFAAQVGDLACAQVLLKSPHIKLNLVGSKYGYTPLHFAVHNGHYNVVRELVVHPNVDFNALDASGKTAFQLAESRGDRTSMMMIYAAIQERENSVRAMRPAAPSSHDAPTVIVADSSSSTSVERPCASLSMGTEEEIIDDLPALLSEIDILAEACCANDFETMKQLICSGIDANTIVDDHLAWTPLFYAVRAGDVEAIGFLLRHGAQPDVVDALGDTPLKLHEEIVKLRDSTDTDMVVKLLFTAHSS